MKMWKAVGLCLRCLEPYTTPAPATILYSSHWHHTFLISSLLQ